MNDHPQRDDPDRRHSSGWKLEEHHEEPKPSLGGTLEAPPHESTEATVPAWVVWRIVGGLMVRAPEMSRGDAKEVWRRQRREIDEPASSPEMLAREIRAFFTFLGGLLIALASVGLVVAVRGE